VVIIASISTNLLGNVINWLSFQGVMLIPLFAVVLVDYFVLRSRQYHPAALFERNGPYWGSKGFNVIGYLAWVVGAVAYVVFSHALPEFGGSILSFVAAGLVYFVAGKLWHGRGQLTSPSTPVRNIPSQTQ
jgi:nucleobase:cation symporter-1, NCS1 family